MTHSTLIEKLRAADGPDRELDAEILEALRLVTKSEHDAIVGIELLNVLSGRTYLHPAPVSASIDAALALVAEVLPGCTRDVDATVPEWGIDVHLHPLSGGEFKGTHESEPIATILALFTALEGERA